MQKKKKIDKCEEIEMRIIDEEERTIREREKKKENKKERESSVHVDSGGRW